MAARTLAFPALCAGLTVASGALAAGERDLQEVLVTARKIAEPLREAPLTVASIAGTTLDREGIRDIEALAALAPGMTVDGSGFPNDVRIALRGVTSDRGRPSVAVLLDGTDLSSENLYVFGGTASVNSRLLDLERVEVVRGTQTVLQGRNAFAGAINYVSRRPAMGAWGGNARIELGSGGLSDAELAVDLPLVSDSLAARVHVASHKLDGYYNNPVTGEALGGERGLAASASLAFESGEAWSGWLRLGYSDDEAGQQAVAYVAPNARRPVPGAVISGPPGSPPGTPAAPCPPTQLSSPCGRPSLAGAITADESRIQLSPDPILGGGFDGSDTEQRIGTLEIRRDGGDWRFTSLSGWLDNDSHQRFDGDFSNYPAASLTALSITNLSDQEYAQRQWTQELRVDGEHGAWRWLAGALAMDERYSLVNHDQFYLRNPASLLRFPSPAFPNGLAASAQPAARYPLQVTRETRHYSVFGALHREFGSRWAVGLEARYSQDDIDYRQGGWTVQEATLTRGVPACPAVQPGRTPSSCGIAATIDSSEFTPRAILEFRPAAGQLVYLSAARGFKPAGYNVNEITTYTDQQYKPESLWSDEAGFKGGDAAGRLVIDAALFYNRYTDQQIGTQKQTAGLLPTSAIVNAGRVDSYGLETALRWQMNDVFTADLGYAYSHAQYDELIYGGIGGRVASDLLRAESGNATGDFSGNDVARTPRHAVRLALEAQGQLGESGLQWSSAVAMNWRSRRYIDESNLSWMPSVGLVDLRAGVQGGNWDATFYVDNLLDEDRIQSAIRFIDLGTTESFAPQRDYLAFLPKPRTAGMRIALKF